MSRPICGYLIWEHDRLKTVSTRSIILSQFEQVAKEQKKQLAPLSDDLLLLDSGLDSLCFAIIVARLEDALGIDPFGADEDLEFPVTLSDFINFYEDAAK
jgi:acyl carrier protein